MMFTFTLLITAMLLHPVHETVSEVEWNSETKRLEVAMRLDPLDEQWLKKQAGKDVELSKWAVEYLSQRFRITAPTASTSGLEKDTANYHWVGRDDKNSYVWWYFEIEPADGRQPKWIDQRVLLDRDENYVNRILVLGQVPRRALTLTIQRPKAYLDRADDESTSQPNSDRRSHLDR